MFVHSSFFQRHSGWACSFFSAQPQFHLRAGLIADLRPLLAADIALSKGARFLLGTAGRGTRAL